MSLIKKLYTKHNNVVYTNVSMFYKFFNRFMNSFHLIDLQTVTD